MSSELESIDSFNNKANGGVKKLPNETAVLVLGILSIVGCFCYAIPGLVMGIIALVLSRSNKSLYESDPDAYNLSYSNAKAGRICAIIGLCTSIAYFLFWVVYFVVIIFAFATVGNGGYDSMNF